MPTDNYFEGIHNGDIEQMPTPPQPGEREVVTRLKVNARSLRMLSDDVSIFTDRAVAESLKKSPDRDTDKMENTMFYFKRMYSLLARISNDIAGHEYTSPHVRDPLQYRELDIELYDDIKDAFRQIEEAFQTVNRDALIPDNSIKVDPNWRELFPFGHWVERIEDMVRMNKHTFGIK